jgi:predicted nucleotidyltransferase
VTHNGEAMQVRFWNMLETLISSRTRIKLLHRLFLNPSSTAYLRGMAEEFNESTNAIRIELNRFEEAGMLISKNEGNKKVYQANQQHPLFNDIHSIVLKYLGIDRIIEAVIKKSGNLEKVYISGDYAMGKNTDIIDLLFIGDVNKNYLNNLIKKVEGLLGKKVRYLVYSLPEWHILEFRGSSAINLLLWENKDEI